MPSRVIYLLYRALLLAAFPFILAYVAYRCVRNRAYLQTLPERFGFLPYGIRPAAAGAIWIHAVSVGEVISAAPLVTRLRALIPGCKVFVSVSTLAGREIARQKLTGVADGVFFAPLDFVWAVRHVLRRLRPALVIVMETEIWPNLWREATRAGAGLLVLNGRISDRAMPRYESWRWFFGPVLRNADRILAQTEVSRGRFVTLGAAPEAVTIGGNLKYDFDPVHANPPDVVLEWAERGKPGLLWVAASTMPPARTGDVDEEEAVLDVYTRLLRDIPRLRLILVPRRPERFATAAASLDRRGLAYLRRSALPAPPPEGEAEAPRILLLDSMGELAGVFRLADVVFVGGTLNERGGHNILEPAFFGKPVIIGPHMENFPEIAADFLAARACLPVADEAGLEEALRQVVLDEALRVETGARARAQALSKTGATATAIDESRRLYEQSLPRPFNSLPLSALAVLWRAGGHVKRAKGLAAQKSLPRPVVSVGGMGVGGAGKTPLVMHVAKLLGEAGRAPAFLTRGYRRVSREACSVIPPGSMVPVEQTGDEAQLLVRSALGPVAICAQRARAGRELLEEYTPDVLLLDDGFQHAQLARDIDLVVIDTLDPFGGFNVIPAGRLREPLEALSRATAFVLMRCEAGRTYDGIVRVLGEYNPTAPVFRARLKPTGWTDLATGEPIQDPGAEGGAFCGVGNPASFWRTLEQLQLKPAFQEAFPDHHRYHPRDLTRLAAQARHNKVQTLWTTQKDAMNLPSDWTAMDLPFRILALSVGVCLEGEPAFLLWLLERLGSK